MNSKMKITFFLGTIVLFVFSISCTKDNIEIETKIVINELLPKNQSYGKDQNGQYDDWIELYNPNEENVDLSGYFLSDSKKSPTKWKFPAGTIINKKDYLIVWADKDTLQAGLHTNYKLSSGGESVILSSPDKKIIDQVEFTATEFQQSFARIPNGTGVFRWGVPTFNGPNN